MTNVFSFLWHGFTNGASVWKKIWRRISHPKLPAFSQRLYSAIDITFRGRRQSVSAPAGRSTCWLSADCKSLLSAGVGVFPGARCFGGKLFKFLLSPVFSWGVKNY